MKINNRDSFIQHFLLAGIVIAFFMILSFEPFRILAANNTTNNTVTKVGSEYDVNIGSQYDANRSSSTYTKCTDPGVTNGHDSAPTFSSGSTTEKWTVDVKQDYETRQKWSNGTYTVVSTGTKTISTDQARSTNHTCSVTSSSNNSYDITKTNSFGGTSTVADGYRAYTSYPGAADSNTVTGYNYHVSTVSVWYSSGDQVTYDVDENKAGYPNCSAKYYDGTNYPCTANETSSIANFPSDANSNIGSISYYKTCYGFARNSFTDYDCSKHYFVTSASVTVTDSSRENVAPPTLASGIDCTRKYDDGHTVNCEADNKAASGIYSSSYFKGYRKSTDKDKIVYCYKYTNSKNSVSDEECHTRYLVTKVTVSGPDNLYTGISDSNFTCKAEFGSNSSWVEDVSDEAHVWRTYRANTNGISFGDNDGYIDNKDTSTGFMGSKREYYTDPKDSTKKYPSSASVNTFYSFDPRPNLGQVYKVECRYYDHRSGFRTEWYFADTNATASGENRLAHGDNTYNDSTGDAEFRTSTYTPTYHGIKDFQMVATGGFNDNSSTNYKSIDKYTNKSIIPNASTSTTTNLNDKFDDYDFITGHWYDFKAYIRYDDNSNGSGTTGTGDNPSTSLAGWRNITNVKEVQWLYSPEYKNKVACTSSRTGDVTSGYSCDTLMPYNGVDHRVSGDGWNKITIKYFDNVDLSTTSNASSYDTAAERMDNSNLTTNLWAHQIVKMEIRGYPGGYSTKPHDGLNGINDETKIFPGTHVYYSAWVFWSDDPDQTIQWRKDYGGDTSLTIDKYKNPWNRGEQEDWTNYVMWSGQDLVLTDPDNPSSYKENDPTTYDSGHYQFNAEGNNFKRTVMIRYGDFDELYSSSQKNWDAQYAQLEVTLSFDCNDTTHLAWGCDYTQYPNKYWRTHFNNPSINFLPPPEEYGFPNWDGDNNPYEFKIKFPVTGISTGNGRY